jgi:ABC-type transport system involved in multi-copper enzyme maturation permease subunit
MLSLVYKDFLLQRGAKPFIYMLVMPVISSFAFSGDILYGIMPYIAGSYLYIVYANALDDKYNSEKMLAAMPVGRNTIIGAKYLGVFLYLAAFLVVMFILSNVSRLFMTNAAQLSPLQGHHIVQFLFIASLYYGVFFPVYFKVGYQKSRWANYLALLAAAGLFALATKGMSTITGTEITSLQASLTALTGLGEKLWTTVLPLLSAAIIGVSMVLSTRFYRKREF